VVLLISTYDLGRQPFGLASAAAALRADGHAVACADLAKERLNPDLVSRADLVAFFLPMHTATRLAVPVIERVRSANPNARLAAYGLYAPLNDVLLRERGVTTIIGGEFEDDLVRAARGAEVADATRGTVPRVTFRVPDRLTLLPLTSYATLQVGDERRVAGHTEASRGCKHRCRHCPIVPVYDGRFRVVPLDVVFADIHAQVAAGAQHITFGDPDFFNGIGHVKALVERLAKELPGLSYDVTIKIEHLLQHADLLPVLRDSGCAFVTSAVESVDDRVLEALDKGHTRADFEQVARHCREVGLVLAPTFVAFTPWTTLDGYCDLLQSLDRLDLVGQAAPIQLAIRLLVTEGSRLLELEAIRTVIGPFSPQSLTYPWVHADPRVDALQKQIETLVGANLSAERHTLFDQIWEVAHAAARLMPPPRVDRGRVEPAPIPHLSEPWYCCAEPTTHQLV
jgi:radical SAM superfamily enzyme YgiQ (UPF0313 family)